MAVIRYYRFNGNLNDASGNGYNLSGGTVSYFSNIGLNGSAYFDASGTINATEIGGVNGNKTISCFMRISPLASVDTWSSPMVLDYYNNKVRYKIAYRCYSNVHDIYLERSRGTYGAEYVFDPTPQTPPTGTKFFHYVLTLSGTTMSLFIEGVYKSSTTINTGDGSTYMVGGGIKVMGADSVKVPGYLDETKIDDTAWSYAKVKNEYSRVKGFFSN